MSDTYSVYVSTDTTNNIIVANSSAFLSDVTGWTKIDEGTGDKYHHAQGNYFDKPIRTDRGIYRYKLVDGAVTAKTDVEIATEEAAVVTPVDELTQIQLALAELADLISGGAS